MRGKSLVVQLDALLTLPPKGLRMTARRRDALTGCLLDLIDNVMAYGADDTLRGYNALLTQLKSLESTIARAIEDAKPPGSAMVHGCVKRPEQLEQLMDADIRTMARTVESLRVDVRDLDNPKLRGNVINELMEMAEGRRMLEALDEIAGDYFR